MNGKEKTVYALKFVIPLTVVIALFIGGMSSGIISFEKPKAENNNDVFKLNVTINIDFGDGSKASYLIDDFNGTVYDFLFEASLLGDFTVESTYWQQFDSYVIDSITYNEDKYASDSSHYWAYYLNGAYGTIASDKQVVKQNDTIDWIFEEF